MASGKKHRKKNPKKWVQKLRDKYRLVILNEETLEEKFSFRLSRLNVFIAIGALAILLIFLTTYIIAFTPLREYIPGYASVDFQKNLYDLGLKADSIEQDFRQKDLYIHNIKNIIEGKEIDEKIPVPKDSAKSKNYANIKDTKSKEDSMLREEVESQNKYSLSPNFTTGNNTPSLSISSQNFYCPLKGMITNEFNPRINHYGIDIVSQKNEAIEATLSGTVIFANWTVETGWVIAIQHQGNIISVYKHNSVLLKKQGSFVKAGEPIAIVGETGELSSGPHLHFELWYNGNPINPKEYISF